MKEFFKSNKANILISLGGIFAVVLIVFLISPSEVGEAETTTVINETSTEESTTADVSENATQTVAEPQTTTLNYECPTNVIVEEFSTVVYNPYGVPLDGELQMYIIEACNRANISPALVFAIIEKESNYDVLAVGDGGDSLGIMQIQPKWHQWRMEAVGGRDWLNPYDNIAVGIHILTDLFETYGDDVYMVLMAYNGGRSYAEKMEQKGEISNYAKEVSVRAEELDQGR